MQFYCIAFRLKIMGHENSDNNLESLCIFSVVNVVLTTKLLYFLCPLYQLT
jgi:hypothetical protein